MLCLLLKRGIYEPARNAAQCGTVAAHLWPIKGLARPVTRCTIVTQVEAAQLAQQDSLAPGERVTPEPSGGPSRSVQRQTSVSLRRASMSSRPHAPSSPRGRPADADDPGQHLGSVWAAWATQQPGGFVCSMWGVKLALRHPPGLRWEEQTGTLMRCRHNMRCVILHRRRRTGRG